MKKSSYGYDDLAEARMPDPKPSPKLPPLTDAEIDTMDAVIQGGDHLDLFALEQLFTQAKEANRLRELGQKVCDEYFGGMNGATAVAALDDFLKEPHA